MRWTLCLLLVSLWPAAAQAAVFHVDDASDRRRQTGLSDPCLCLSTADTCTLRAAIETANVCLGFDEVHLDHPGPYVLDRVGSFENAAFTGDLDVIEDVRVVATVGNQIDAPNLHDRIFHVPQIRGSGTALTLDGVTLTRGHAPPGRNGGCVLVEYGRLEMVGSSAYLCEAASGGAIALTMSPASIRTSQLLNDTADLGGGIYVEDSELVLFQTIVSSNKATDGGGVYATGSEALIIEESAIRDNTAFRAGGGLWIEAPTTTLRSQIRDNFAEYAGAALIYRTTLTGTETDVFDNASMRDGAGLYGHDASRIELDHSSLYGNVSARLGGAIYARSLVYLFNVTVHDNEAMTGPALYGTSASFAYANNSSVADNVSTFGLGTAYGIDAPLVRLRNTVVEKNGDDCSPGVTSLGHVVSPSAACLAGGASGNIQAFAATVPQTIGTTRYLELVTSSPAVDAGDNATCEADDQRFVSRPQGSACDIGSWELEP